MLPKLWTRSNTSGRGAFCKPTKASRKECAGGIRNENAGMSSDKKCEKHFRRKPKVSWVKLIFPGLVGP